MKIKSLVARRNAIVLAVATFALVASGSVAMALGGVDHARQKVVDGVKVNPSGGICKAGFDAETGDITPPDDTVTDNAPAGKVVFTKKCVGAVSIAFSGEATPGSSGFIHLTYEATCVGSGGYKHHCKIGNSKLGEPGHTFFSVNHSGTEDNSMTEVITGLKRGKWDFEVLPGGDGSGSLGFRTTAVQAYSGG
jgi:hypothetical protein